MELVWFELNGYKRFAELSKMHVGGKLVAVVGPNEAGKTSLLRGLLHFSQPSAFSRDGASQEITRGKLFDDEHIVAEYTFALEHEDCSQLAREVPEASHIRWFTICKSASGTISCRVSDPPKRDLTLRQKLSFELKEVNNSIKATSTNCENSLEEIASIATVLDSKNESLSDRELQILRVYIQSADSSNIINQKIFDQIPELIAHEEREHPEEHAKTLLRKRCPQILLFSDKDRELLSEYDLNSFFRAATQQAQPEPIPPALQHLVSTANLDLKELHTAQSKRDQGRIRTILDRANTTLSQKIQDTWKQSNLSVSIELNQWKLTILIRSEQGEYIKIAERSDGLRQFLALLMFLSQEPNLDVAPIVLIDEAERHLHYDAQADLIQMFTRQNAASKIIYTTHSIGCLPEDLGCVRMISVDDPNSKVVNWFWDSDTPGFSPLLFAMGANALAFIPIRYAVIAEGAADMILVPALLKSALRKDELGFQVVPSLSSVKSESIAIIDNQSPRTAYLVDADEGGEKLRSQIISAGVAGGRVVNLPNLYGQGSATAIEDFVEPKTYVRAVNEELKRSYGENVQVKISDINGPNVSKLLEIWCDSKKIKPPSKRAVAYRLVEDCYDYPLVRRDAHQRLRELYESLRRALGLNLH